MITWYGKPGRAAHLPKWNASTDGFARAIATRCGKLFTRSMRHVEPELLRECCGQCVWSASLAGLITVDSEPDHFHAPAPVEVAVS